MQYIKKKAVNINFHSYYHSLLVLRDVLGKVFSIKGPWRDTSRRKLQRSFVLKGEFVCVYVCMCIISRCVGHLRCHWYLQKSEGGWAGKIGEECGYKERTFPTKSRISDFERSNFLVAFGVLCSSC